MCCNVISLGIVATDMTEKIRSDEKLREIYMNRILLKRFAEADDITPAFVFGQRRGQTTSPASSSAWTAAYGMI